MSILNSFLTSPARSRRKVSWQRAAVGPVGGARLVAMIACLAGAFVGGCSDGGGSDNDGAIDDGNNDGGPCTLTIATINGVAPADIESLGAGDDQDPNTLGLQLDIRVEVANAAADTSATLVITGLSPDPNAAVVDGIADFKAVSVGPTLTQVSIAATAPKCANDVIFIPIVPAPECFFERPVDGGDTPSTVTGAALGQNDDKNQENGTFDYDVIVRTVNAPDSTVVLNVAGIAQSPQKTGNDGRALFADTVLPLGDDVALSASLRLGDVVRECRARISVDSNLPKCNISFDPGFADSAGEVNALGKDQDSDSSTPGIETTIRVETEVGVDRVVLILNGSRGTAADASAGAAQFLNESLSDTGDTALHDIRVSCENSNTGVASSSQSVSVLVDALPPPAVATLDCFASQRRAGEATCRWTAVGPGVSHYEVKYVTEGELNDSTWAAAEQAAPLVVASAAGSDQTLIISDLPGDGVYRFGIRALDRARNAAPTTAANDVALGFTTQILGGVDSQSAWGRAMAAGDFDCDGLSDLAVGDVSAEGGKGKVYIYPGTNRGFAANPTKIIRGTAANGAFGARLAALANFNADTIAGKPCADLAVLAAHGDTSQAKVYLYLGRAPFPDRKDIGAGTGADVIYSLSLTADAGDKLGAALESAGDLNQDGASDLALTYQQTTSGSASVLVIYGDKALQPLAPNGNTLARELPAAAGLRIDGGRVADGFGTSLCGGASVDVDAFGDLLIGAPRAQVEGQVRGAVYVVQGAAAAAGTSLALSLEDARIHALAGSTDDGSFGASLAVVGDMNADGSAEFAISDPKATGGAGAVYVFNMAGDTPPSAPAEALFKIENDSATPANGSFGSSLACSAEFAAPVDVNADAKADILVSGTGAAYLFAGAEALTDRLASAPDRLLSAPASAAGGQSLTWVRFGGAITWLGDIDGDGIVDLAVADAEADDGKGRIVILR